jgi:hypothetical protein
MSMLLSFTFLTSCIVTTDLNLPHSLKVLRKNSAKFFAQWTNHNTALTTPRTYAHAAKIAQYSIRYAINICMRSNLYYFMLLIVATFLYIYTGTKHINLPQSPTNARKLC